MKDKIKEKPLKEVLYALDYIGNKLKNDDGAFDSATLELSVNNCKILIDYITNLQERLEVSQTNEETYRLEMEDITKCLGLAEDKIFDEVKEYATNLQEGNKRLTRTIIDYDELLMQKNNAIDKAIEKLKYYSGGEADYYVPIDNIIDILKGSDK